MPIKISANVAVDVGLLSAPIYRAHRAVICAQLSFLVTSEDKLFITAD